ncbi:MAG: leucine--tRNA ligase, partial [Clostridiales bacterium]|nr:leucine--tRNA ligase [Clostridiales bacterium]
QWMLKITEYAQRLLDDLSEVNYLDKIKATQTNWIGRSTGAEVDFITTTGDVLTVYTTRPDTLFGATYMVISPEHPLIGKWADKLSNNGEIREYQEKSSHKSDFERTEMVKDKTGVELKGVKAVNPVNNMAIPIYISDYVLMTYGTGAIMAVPAHDTRDYDFAKTFDLPIVEVVKGGNIEVEAFTDCETGVMVNSGFLNGLSVEDAQEKIKKWLEENKKGVPKVNYKLRDWVFSRQRYWGEPIPIVHCEKCGYVALPESELPLRLPDVESYMPTDNGESPLSTLESFINTTCPDCGGPAKRETDTMPQWAGSSWYYLRYCDPHNKEALASREALDYWMPVDWYNGGMEHTTLHLLYSRFWHKFLYDIDITTQKEPYMRRTSHGMILGEDGQKMSKSRGNVISPDDVIKAYGADTLRLYEMFIGDFEKTAPWSPSSIKGCKRFLDRVWALQDCLIDGDDYRDELKTKFHKAIKKVTEDIESLKFNTAIATMMALLNDIYTIGTVNKKEYRDLLIMLNPFAPHITEELYEIIGYDGVLNQQSWVKYDEELCLEETVEIVIQINGKVRERIVIGMDLKQEEVLNIAKKEPKIAEALSGKSIIKEIYVQNKLVNFVVR